MFAGDVFTCQKQLSAMLKRDNVGDVATVESIQKMIAKFAKDSFIPVEYSEKLLTNVGNLMERCSDDSVLANFAANVGFADVLTTILSEFATRVSPAASTKTICPSSFSSHYCYELALFMLLGLLDKTHLLKVFVHTVATDGIHRLIGSICSVILMDHLYLTQVCQILLSHCS